MSSLINEIQENIVNFKNELIELDYLLSKIEEDNNFLIESKFLKMFNAYKCNPLLIMRFINYLEINKSKSVNSYSINDIKNIFDSTSKLYSDFIELNVEKYYFYFNVMDEEDFAKKELDNFIRKYEKALTPAIRSNSPDTK